MDNMNLNKHISGQFNTELEAVRNNVLAMGGLVEQQLADALVAIHDQDMELARRIVETDLKVNSMEISIDEECTRIIAKRQPTASDLRLILMISKAVTDLERMGDVADRLARMVINNTSRSHPPLVSLESCTMRWMRLRAWMLRRPSSSTMMMTRLIGSMSPSFVS